jgi:subtilase family serine protease
MCRICLINIIKVLNFWRYLLAILIVSNLNSTVCANVITDENLNLGSRGWVLSGDGSGHDATDLGVQIKGYLSATSVNKGGQIDFKVSVTPAQNFTIEIYRVGWYNGMGGRLMQTIGPIVGITQQACPRYEAIGIIDCNWSTSYTLNVPTNWVSGVYLAKLKNASGFDSGAIFVVRDDNRIADFLYQQPITTYHAYNQYPEGVNGKSLYGNMLGESQAYKVSLNRPYAGYRSSSNGYGDFPMWEIMLIKWLEKEGYDVTYSTDVDTHANGARLTNYKGFFSGGHDEYWSKEMVDAAQNARDTGTNLAFFGSNAVYWQVRFEPDDQGNPNRTLVCYKNSSIDPISNPALKTDLFRSVSVNRPEQHLMGAQYISYNSMWKLATYTSLIVKNSNHWVYQGSGLAEGQGIPGLVGYEIDRVDPAVPLPANSEHTVLAHSPFLSIYGENLNQDTVIYKAPGNGGWVFTAGTMSWSWGLEHDMSYSYLGDRRSPALQTITKNILNRFKGVNAPPQGLPVIVGLTQEQQTLTVDNSGISDPDGLGAFSYQWLRDGINIIGAVTSSYLLEASDVGKAISVVVTYTDGLGKLETVTSVPTQLVTVENELPTVAITAPADSSTVAGTIVTISATATDNVAVIGVQFKLDGVNLTAEDVSAPYSIIWDSTQASNGSHNLTAVARDAAGNSATSSSVVVTVNNVVPVLLPDLVVTDLAYNNGVFTSTVKNQGLSTIANGTVIQVNYAVDGINQTLGAITTGIPVGGSVTVGTTGDSYLIPAGIHAIKASVDETNLLAEEDETNNSLSQSITIADVDSTAPTVAITAPANTSSVSGTSVSISATATDNVAVIGVQFKLDGVNLAAEDVSAPYDIVWDSTQVSNGSHSLTAVARDAAGNVASSSSVTVSVNNTVALLPDVVVTSLTYSNGVFTSTIKNQGTKATPSGVTIGVGYSVDGVYKTWGARSTPLAVRASATIGTNGAKYTIPNGNHTITSKVDDVNRFTELDETNNILSQAITVGVVDTTLPTVSITAPANNATVTGASVALTANAADNIAVVGVQFKLDGISLGNEDITVPYSINWNTTTTANGSHTLTAVARDTSNNTAISSSVIVNVSNTGATLLPDVVVTSVSYSAGRFTCTVKNQGTKATPSGVVIGVGYSVDGVYKTWGARSTALAAGASATIGTNGSAYNIPAGNHTITAFVDDLNRFPELDETNNKLTQPIAIP